MRILSIETSAKACSAAVTEDGALLASAFQCSGLTHSRTLMPMVEGMLKNADLTLTACDAVAVAVGPGSFTGDVYKRQAVAGVAQAGDDVAVLVEVVVPVSYTHLLWTPKRSPVAAYSVTAQFIRDAKGMGYIFSDIGFPPCVSIGQGFQGFPKGRSPLVSTHGGKNEIIFPATCAAEKSVDSAALGGVTSEERLTGGGNLKGGRSPLFNTPGD